MSQLFGPRIQSILRNYRCRKQQQRHKKDCSWDQMPPWQRAPYYDTVTETVFTNAPANTVIAEANARRVLIAFSLFSGGPIGITTIFNGSGMILNTTTLPFIITPDIFGSMVESRWYVNVGGAVNYQITVVELTLLEIPGRCTGGTELEKLADEYASMPSGESGGTGTGIPPVLVVA